MILEALETPPPFSKTRSSRCGTGPGRAQVVWPLANARDWATVLLADCGKPGHDAPDARGAGETCWLGEADSARDQHPGRGCGGLPAYPRARGLRLGAARAPGPARAQRRGLGEPPSARPLLREGAAREAQEADGARQD